MPFETVITDQRFHDLLGRLSGVTDDLSEPLEGIAYDIQNHIDLEFAEGVDPYGEKWAELQSPRKKRKGKKQIGKKDQVLVDTAILATSFTEEGAEGGIFEIGDDFVRVGSGMEYAQTHDKGDDERNIPQRQIVPDPDNMPDDLMEVIIDRLQNHFGLN